MTIPSAPWPTSYRSAAVFESDAQERRFLSRSSGWKDGQQRHLRMPTSSTNRTQLGHSACISINFHGSYGGNIADPMWIQCIPLGNLRATLWLQVLETIMTESYAKFAEAVFCSCLLPEGILTTEVDSVVEFHFFKKNKKTLKMKQPRQRMKTKLCRVLRCCANRCGWLGRVIGVNV